MGVFSLRVFTATAPRSPSASSPKPRENRRRLLEEPDSGGRRHRERVVAGTSAYRLIYGESDGIPSLIVDRYGDHWVVQTLSQGAEKIMETIAALLRELFQPLSILLRNDLSVRSLEGLPQEKKVLHGEPPALVEVFEETFATG